MNTILTILLNSLIQSSQVTIQVVQYPSVQAFSALKLTGENDQEPTKDDELGADNRRS